jgi:hypothetical protein
MGFGGSKLGTNPVAADGLDIVGRDGKLLANGLPFSIKGVNWFGSEAYCGYARHSHRPCALWWAAH